MYLAWKEAWELPRQVTQQVSQQVSRQKKSAWQPGTQLVTRPASRQRVEARQEYCLPRQRWRQVGWQG
jgi:hypothetical protein